jgi:hypothetical protein
MKENGDVLAEDLPLSTLTQRCVLKYGEEVLESLFQEALASLPETTTPPLVGALARFVTPGVHVTLVWRPHLERAVADAHPGKTVYAVQPSFTGAGGKPRVVKRAAGAAVWRMEPALPRRFDLDQEIVVLRLFGGDSAEARPIFSKPILTDDAHIQGVLGVEGSQPPLWLQELLSRPRIQPCLFVGLSALDWRHRLLLSWLLDKRSAPQGSLALLPARVDPDEPGIWESGGGLPGAGRIVALQEDPAALVPALDAHTPGGAP